MCRETYGNGVRTGLAVIGTQKLQNQRALIHRDRLTGPPRSSRGGPIFAIGAIVIATVWQRESQTRWIPQPDMRGFVVLFRENSYG